MEYNTRILIVDDNESIHDDFRKVLLREQGEAATELSELEKSLFGNQAELDAGGEDTVQLPQAYEIDSAYQGQEALRMVNKAEELGRPYALAFVDVRMPPGWDGVETILRIWEKYPYIEMVLCTAYSDYSWDEIVAQLGSTDKLLFIRKPFDAVTVQQTAMTLIKKWNLGQQARHYVDELESEVDRRTEQLKTLLEELENKNRQLEMANRDLEHVALHDGLTKLPNRLLFQDRLVYSIKLADRENTPFMLGILDLDNFKDINDTYGHQVGDLVLREVGDRLLLALRSSDTVARLGGDEFAIICPSAGQDTVKPVIDKILQQFDKPVIINDHSHSVSISIGTVFYPEHGKDDVNLLKFADLAMYQAKRAGAGYRVFDPQEHQQVTYQERLVADLKEAIEQRQLALYYQPIIDLSTHRVASLEALARWHHPEHGFIPPDKFIRLAEQKGLIQALTLWVLEEAVSQCARWHQQGARVGVSINLSVRNFLDPDLPERVRAALDSNSLEPRWLILEITESMMMTNPEKAIQIIETFKQMGVQLSIDDFGTGYSSLSYLKKIPVQELKIDRSFVMNMDNDADDRVIVQSTIELAHTLGRTVVAEGVESQGNYDLLTSLGCDRAQGYHMCKPLSASDMSQWLFESDWAVKKKAG